MQISTDEQKKAILAVLECGNTFDSGNDALKAASSAVKSALGKETIESLNIGELQEMGFVEMHAPTVRGRERFKWRLTDTTRAQFDSDKRSWFEGELGSSHFSIRSIEPLWLSDQDLVRFSLGHSAPRDRMRAYIRENLRIMHRAKAWDQSG